MTAGTTYSGSITIAKERAAIAGIVEYLMVTDVDTCDPVRGRIRPQRYSAQSLVIRVTEVGLMTGAVIASRFVMTVFVLLRI